MQPASLFPSPSAATWKDGATIWNNFLWPFKEHLNGHKPKRVSNHDVLQISDANQSLVQIYTVKTFTIEMI